MRNATPVIVLIHILSTHPSSAASCIVQLASGGDHTLARLSDGSLIAWGGNFSSQLGFLGPDSPVPVSVLIPPRVASIAGGSRTSFAVMQDGTGLAWGGNFCGQVGNGQDRNDVVRPALIAGLPPATVISGGNSYALALAADGTVWAWGCNAFGPLGNGTTVDSNVPLQVPAFDDVVAVAAGATSSYAVRRDGTLWAWGDNRFGQLGLGDQDNRLLPTRVTALGPVREVAGQKTRAFVVQDDGTLWGFGRNDYGQLGDGTTTDRLLPIPLVGLVDHHPTPGGEPWSWARSLGPDRAAWTWGEPGQYGNPGDTTPRPVAGLPDLVQVSGGHDFVVALDVVGDVWSWGENSQASLGNGTTVSSNVPARALASSGDSIPPDQGNVLRATRSGPDVVLEFTGAPASAWRVYRDSDPSALGTTELGPDATTPSYVDAAAVTRSPSLLFYRVRGLSECFQVPGP